VTRYLYALYAADATACGASINHRLPHISLISSLSVSDSRHAIISILLLYINGRGVPCCFFSFSTFRQNGGRCSLYCLLMLYAWRYATAWNCWCSMGDRVTSVFLANILNNGVYSRLIFEKVIADRRGSGCWRRRMENGEGKNWANSCVHGGTVGLFTPE